MATETPVQNSVELSSLRLSSFFAVRYCEVIMSRRHGMI